jgi:hypothetical protein
VSSTKFTRRDINRFRKVYPYTPRRKVIRSVSDDSFIIEEGTISFSSESSGSYTFLETYSSAPNVVVTAFDSAGNEQVGVGLNITAITTTSVTVQSTAAFTGTVNVQVLQVGA